MINLQKPVERTETDITDRFINMLRNQFKISETPVFIRKVEQPVLVVETGDDKRYALEIRTVACSDLDYAVKELASYGPDIIFIKEVTEENLNNARRYKIRFQLIKYVGNTHETDY